MGTFAGTLAEYNPKVIQFGYIAMFSAACPPAALFAALANILELRFDARKVRGAASIPRRDAPLARDSACSRSVPSRASSSHLSSMRAIAVATQVTVEMRRPRYAGAEDIGTWQYVLGLFSWVAIVVNVMLICFTSRDLREALIIPCAPFDTHTHPTDARRRVKIVSSRTSHRYLADNEECLLNVTDPGLISDHSAFYGKNNTYMESCKETYLDCWEEMGGVEWLPGTVCIGPAHTALKSTSPTPSEPSQSPAHGHASFSRLSK